MAWHTKAGSSPRTRGTGPLPPNKHLGQRFIPAHAGNGNSLAIPVHPLPVHPRVRGERSFLHLHRVHGDGSSPRTRGTGKPCFDMRHHIRFIPAHAGNGDASAASPRSAPVHPRARGERVISGHSSAMSSGSSPRTRGTAIRGIPRMRG